MAKKFRRTRRKQRKTHKRGGSFKSVLGSIGNTLLSVAPLVLSALGRKKKSALGRRRRFGRGLLSNGVVQSSAYPTA